MVFESALFAYLDHLRIERGLSNNSIAAYRRDLVKFGNFLSDENRDFQALNPQEILDFEVRLKNQNLSTASINRSLSALKGFFHYCEEEYEIANPTFEANSHRLARKLPKALTIEEILHLIASADREGDPISYRDSALLELLYSTGARVSEIIYLNVTDIASSKTGDGEVPVVRVRGKGSKERLVPLGSFALQAVDQYLTRTRPLLIAKSKKNEGALFLNHRGARLSRQKIGRAHV